MREVADAVFQRSQAAFLLDGSSPTRFTKALGIHPKPKYFTNASSAEF
jgi:hypothetical protein